MKRIQCIASLLLVISLMGCHNNQSQSKQAESAQNNWVLDTDNSQFSFITTKNKTFAEEHRIQFKSGHISDQNWVHLELDLNTLDTGIPIRDERMKTVLFDTETNPVILINTQLPSRMPVYQNQSMPFTVTINGIEKDLMTQLMVQKVDQTLVVTSFEPVQVNAKDFKLDGGVNELTKLAGLQSINYDISAEYTLRFEQADRSQR